MPGLQDLGPIHDLARAAAACGLFALSCFYCVDERREGEQSMARACSGFGTTRCAWMMGDGDDDGDGGEVCR